MKPNAKAHLLPKAGARNERRLEAVRCSALFGAVEGRDMVLTHLLHGHPLFYSFNSFFSSFKKRQSVPWTMIRCGVLLITRASCSRRA